MYHGSQQPMHKNEISQEDQNQKTCIVTNKKHTILITTVVIGFGK